MSIIFDFDGTIADSFDVIASIIARLTGRSKQFNEENIDHLRQQPILTVARQLGIRPWKIPWLLVRGRMIMSRHINEIGLHEGMGKAIEQLHAEGHELFIVSTNSTKNVNKFLKIHRMKSHFVQVKGGVGIFGKARALKKLVKRNSLDPKDTWYVGDEARDIEAAKAAGLKCLSVGWGFTNPDTLREFRPTALAEKSEEIIQIINQ